MAGNHICETLILIEEEPKRFEGYRTACIQDLMGPGSDPVSIYQLVGNTKLIRGFGEAEDAVQAFNFLLDRLGAHKLILKQDQNITGGGSHTTKLLISRHSFVTGTATITSFARPRVVILTAGGNQNHTGEKEQESDFMDCFHINLLTAKWLPERHRPFREVLN